MLSVEPSMINSHGAVLLSIWSTMADYDWLEMPEPVPPRGKPLLDASLELLRAHQIHTIVVDNLGSPFHSSSNKQRRHFLRGMDAALVGMPVRFVFAGCSELAKAIGDLKHREFIEHIEAPVIQDSPELRAWIAEPSRYANLSPCNDDMVRGLLAASIGNMIYIDAFLRAAERAVRFDGVNTEIIRRRLMDLNDICAKYRVDALNWRWSVERFLISGQFGST